MSVRYTNDEIESYASALARVASLSNLFSESKTPYIHYRATEYLYARALSADNLARSDIAIDAKRGSLGVGLKTFVYGNKPKFEKIAEFNKELESFAKLGPLDKVRRVSELRNDRLDFAGRLTKVDTFIYHCIARLPGKLFVFETEMPRIHLEYIKITNISGGNITFTDGANRYRFSSSKSTLYKEFYSEHALFEKPVRIYDDPFTLLNSIDLDEQPVSIGLQHRDELRSSNDYVILPLYGRKQGSPYVYDKSGLNQWNASGRKRNENEVYIPIPAEVHVKNHGFFPRRDTPFTLHFPSGDTMTVKVCQENDKALMSQHNADLGEWLLREVLNLKPRQLVTYELLEQIGVDSVEISKINGEYHIDFKSIGTYESYIND